MIKAALMLAAAISLFFGTNVCHAASRPEAMDDESMPVLDSELAAMRGGTEPGFWVGVTITSALYINATRDVSSRSETFWLSGPLPPMIPAPGAVAATPGVGDAVTLKDSSGVIISLGPSLGSPLVLQNAANQQVIRRDTSIDVSIVGLRDFARLVAAVSALRPPGRGF